MTPPLIAQLSDLHIRLDDEVAHRALSAAVESTGWGVGVKNEGGLTMSAYA